MIIRPETEADISAIDRINLEAFQNHPYGHHTEHLIVRALRASGALTLYPRGRMGRPGGGPYRLLPGLHPWRGPRLVYAQPRGRPAFPPEAGHRRSAHQDRPGWPSRPRRRQLPARRRSCLPGSVWLQAGPSASHPRSAAGVCHVPSLLRGHPERARHASPGLLHNGLILRPPASDRGKVHFFTKRSALAPGGNRAIFMSVAFIKMQSLSHIADPSCPRRVPQGAFPWPS